MTHSSNLKKFAKNLNIVETWVLYYPGYYLGPNHKKVLDFWVYWDSLSEDQRNVYKQRLYSLDAATYKKAHWWCCHLYWKVNIWARCFSLSVVDLEIIAEHLFIEKGIPLTFIPLTKDL
jgi:hypothetical protein